MQRRHGSSPWWLLCLVVTAVPTLVWLRAALAGLGADDLGTDYCNFYTGAIQFERHAFYASATFLDTMREFVHVSPATAQTQPQFVQPPQVAILFEPFTLLGIAQAFYLLFAMAIAGTIAGSWFFFEHWPPKQRVVVSVLMPLSWWSLGDLFSGGDAWLVYAGVALVWYGRARNQVWLAAVGLCLALLKPQLGLWILLIVLLDGIWSHGRPRRILIGTLALWLGAPLAITREPGLYGHFARALLDYRHGAQSNQPNVRGLLELVVGDRTATALSVVAVAIGLLVVIWLARDRGRKPNWRQDWLVMTAIALLVTPFDHGTEVWVLLPMSLMVMFPHGLGLARVAPAFRVRCAWWYWMLFPGICFFIDTNGGLASTLFATFVVLGILIGSGYIQDHPARAPVAKVEAQTV